MHQSLNSLPQSLLHHLGAFSRLDTLAELPQVPVALNTLRQSSSGEPYHRSSTPFWRNSGFCTPAC